ncbi:lysophospholipid acyltransferase family protein [Sulfurivermis fontis]|uniref:lysophospholipid acyltransferase family protein n=1 Tax=Sulfurivermis fontis TaxID=1972068 RepID=UPI001558A518|nr:GNAT family N-acyltransferase [Sulfurivermis fontis]
MTACERAHPFRLNGSLRLTRHAELDRLLEGTLEQASALARLDRMYQALPPAADCDEFLQQALDAFNIRVHCSTEMLQRVPVHGPLVVVANHPFGALEGVILARLLRYVRRDVKILANHFLERIPELRELFLSVDPFGGEDATRRNRRPLRQALQHLEQGGLLVVFPAGEVSHRHLDGTTTDPQWHTTVARLVRRTGATVLPVYFPGSNSLLFHLAGLVHPHLRTALLPRELLNKRNRTIAPRIGQPIPFARLKSLADTALTAQLRLRCYALAAQRDARPAANGTRPLEPIADAVATPLLCAEVAALPPEQRLDDSGELQVWYARAGQIPWLLQELGRLRELTFRAVGEGTGRSRDIDLYDAYYLHLFIWDRQNQQVVGAYRLGLADEIVRHFGPHGLYTHSLFRYHRRLLQQIAPAIELGRSFVRPEYQRSYSPLLLLWKGIGQFIARHPRYHTLFGPVSISGDYATQSQQLLVQFLRANNSLPQLARYVRPRRPFRAPLRPAWPQGSTPADLEQLSELVSAIEADEKGVPVLLRQYLKLGGRILGFNVDEAFNNALDGLIMVDLRQTDGKVLAKYMGREAAERFRIRHGVQVETA